MHYDLEHAAGVTDLGQKLRELPNEREPPVRWDEFKRRQLCERARRRSGRRVAQLASIAIVALGALGIWGHFALPPMPSAQRATAPPARKTQLAALAGDEAIRRSDASEQWLAALPEEPIVVHVGTRVAVTDLEDRIAWVDDTLSWMRAAGGGGAGVNALQNERNRLINSLVQVRYAEALAADPP